MVQDCSCQYSSNCRIYEINRASEDAEDKEFVRNCCNGSDRTYCPIFRYHQTVQHQAPPEEPKKKEGFPLHIVS